MRETFTRNLNAKTPRKHTEESPSNDVSITEFLNEVFWEVIKKSTVTTLKNYLRKKELNIPQKCSN